MKSLANSEKSSFLTFNDGIADFYKVRNTAPKGDKPVNTTVFAVRLRFGYETVGVNRFYTAKQADVKLDELIRTPMQRQISAQDIVKISGRFYRIEQVQHVNGTKPPISRFSLSRIEVDYDTETVP